MVQHSFTFVNRTGNPDGYRREDEELPTIRSHAMREVRRRKLLASTGPIASDAVGKDRYVRTKISTSQPLSSAISRAFSGIYSGTAISSNNLPANIGRQLHYFVHGFAPLTFPVVHGRYECDIVRIAMSEGDLALLHSLSAVSTIHQALSKEMVIRQRSPDDMNDMRKVSLSHKQNAVVLLQMNLSKQINNRTESMLATSAILLMLECLSGDITTAEAHRSGLLELAKAHGASLQSSHFLVSDVLMSSIKSASSSLTQPSLTLYKNWLVDFEKLNNLPFVPHRQDLKTMGAGFFAKCISDSLGEDFLQLLHGMRNMINAHDSGLQTGNVVSGVNGPYFLVLEHQLLSLNMSRSQLSDCCRIGLLLYCNLCLWSWPKNTTLVENLLSGLRQSLVWGRIVFTNEQLPLLLWLYFVGNYAALDTEESQWSLEGLKSVTQRLEIHERNDFRNILARFFYLDRLMAQCLDECYKGICGTTCNDLE